MEALIDALLQYSRAGKNKTKPELVNVETLETGSPDCIGTLIQCGYFTREFLHGA
jgi:hypothetical protein